MIETEKDGSVFFERTHLLKLKHRALRAGMWYRLLPRIDRVLVDLTIKVADNVRSSRLARSLLLVASKLESLLATKLSRAVREFGLPLAEKFSQFAQQWGYKAAAIWASDKAYARFWAVLKLNGYPDRG